MAIKILIVDDHEVVREGIRTILRARPEWEVCGEAADGQQAVALAQECNPDVVILDVTMPVMNGLDAAQQIVKSGLATKLLIFTMHDSRGLMKSVRKIGAKGIVLKSYAARDLIRALEAILDGGTFFPDDSRESGQEQGGPGGLMFCQAFEFA